MSNKKTIEIESIWGGSQPRAYADHRWEAFLTFSVPEGQAYASKWPSTAEQVAPIAKALVTNWYEKGEGDWASPRLEKLEQVSTEPNRWHLIVTAPFTD